MPRRSSPRASSPASGFQASASAKPSSSTITRRTRLRLSNARLGQPPAFAVRAMVVRASSRRPAASLWKKVTESARWSRVCRSNQGSGAPPTVPASKCWSSSGSKDGAGSLGGRRARRSQST
jgi:hypothetical protein